MDFYVKVNQSTGEYQKRKNKSVELKNLVFTITPEEIQNKNTGLWEEVTPFVKFSGSIHKYANGGEYNYDRFTFERFLKVANEMKEYISQDDIINTIEFAVNIHTPFNPSLFVNNLISHRNKTFYKKIKKGEFFSEAEHTHSLLKIYDKGLQQGPAGSNILRIEVKYSRMQKLFDRSLKWADFTNINIWESLGDIIRNKFSEVIYYDPSIDLNNVPERDRQIIEKGHNPLFWEKLSGSHIARTRKQYQNLIKKYGKTFNILPSLLDQEIKEVAKSYQFTAETKEAVISTGINEVAGSYHSLYCNYSPITEKTSSTGMFCIVTGIDISMQKKGSRFLSIEGIRFLYKNDRQAYNKLLSELPSKWHNSPLKVQEYRIAHYVRDKFFNPRNSIRRAIKKECSEPALFDNSLLISKRKQEIADTP
ncbi:MAG: hypothetical protein ACMUHX_10415 [bacterium]